MTQKKQEKKLIEKTKTLSIKEGSAYSVSEGLGIRYITPFALKLGATNAHIGLLTSLPSLLGNFSQLFTTKLMEKTSRKKIVVSCAMMQAIMWLLVIMVGVLYFVFGINSTITPAFLIVVYTLLVLFGAFLTPAWNSWMKDIVSTGSGKYFGNRNRIVGFVALVSMLAGIFILDYLAKTKVFLGFVILFTLAFIARAISAFLLSKKYEPKITYEKGYYFSFWQFIRYIPKSNFGKFTVLVALMQLATAIASPFFAVYMLKDLGFSYLQWIIVTIASSLASLLLMPLWGKFADRYGNIKVINMTSFLVAVVPLLWFVSIFVSKSFLLSYLVFVEIFSGMVWAGFNLSSSNFIYDAVTRQRMALCVAYSNLLNGAGVFVGATLGGFVSSMSFELAGIPPILLIFLMSSIARLTVAITMTPKVKEVRDIEKFGIKEARERLSTLTPNALWSHFEISLKPKSGG
ncbi:MAG: MFS transporter [Candidatus Pacearchaeota archaeon]|nr:MFS transporter [Candidatus Pacearchaeota archaeon]